MKGWTRPLLAMALATSALGVAACNRTEAGEATNASEYAEVRRGDLEIMAEAAGQIEPILVVEVKSKASGEVLALNVETGDHVQRGQLLAQVDPRDVRNAYDQADADLQVAKARAQTAQAQMNRTEELRRANVVTEQELESASLEVANAKAQLVKAQTSLQLADERRNDVTIRAPIDGTIIEKTVEVGQIIASASQNVSGGTVLFKMADLSEMQVRALVDETDLGRISAGQPANVSVEAYPDRAFQGTVLKIEPQAVIDQNVTMFPVLVRLDNSEGLLKPGMNGDVQIEIARRMDVVMVPNAAVVGTRDAAAAGMVLGLDEAKIRAAMQASSEMAPMAQPGAAAADGPQAATATPGGAAPTAGSPECEALMTSLRASGFENASAADREKMATCRGAAGANARQGRAGGQGRGGRGGQGRRGTPETRSGVVFVQTATGPELRKVTLGLNDWDNTEVVRGLEAGEKVVLISVARLQAQQQEFVNRMRERAGGPIPGGGNSGGRGR